MAIRNWRQQPPANIEVTSQKRLAAFVVGITILALGVILRGIFAFQRVWWDEQTTLKFISQYNAIELLYMVPIRQPNFGLYYALVDLWATLTTLPPITGRVFSLAAGIALVPVIYLTIRRLIEDNTALLAGILAATAPVFIIQSGWLRMYALLTLATTLSWLLLWQNEQRVWWAVVASVTIWLHPYGLFVVASQIAYVLFVRQGVNYRATGIVSVSFLLASGVLAAKFFRGYLPHIVSRPLSGTALLHIPTPPDALTIVATPAALLVGRIDLAVQIPAAVLVTGLICVGIARRWRSESVQVLLWWAAGPILLAITVSYLASPIYQLKYLVVAAPAVVGLVAVGLSTVKPRLRYTLLAVLVGVQLAAVISGTGDPTWYALRVLQ